MTISVQCASCGHVNSVGDEKAEQQIQCRQCEAAMKVPPAAPVFDDDDSDIWMTTDEAARRRPKSISIMLGIGAAVLVLFLLVGGLLYFAVTYFDGIANLSLDGDGDLPSLSSQDTTASSTNSGENLQNSIGMQLVLLPSAKFTYDQEFTSKTVQPQNSTRLTVNLQSIYMSRYEVTQAQFQKIMGVNPSVYRGTNQPVGRVTFEQAMRFCRKLSEKEGATYRLPTDAEWEYACRAGTTTQYHYGNSLSSSQANFDGNWPRGGAPKGVNRKQTTPVGSFKPNAFGLYDMHGNVWEWCLDVDDSGSGPGHVLRSGGGGSGAVFCRSGTRIRSTGTNEWVGFRVVRTDPGGKEGGESSPPPININEIMTQITEEFAKERTPLPPGVLILPVVDEHGRCTGPGPVLSLTALAAATYSDPETGKKTMDISPGIVRLLFHTDTFMRRGERISRKAINTLRACTGTQLYAVPRLVEQAEQPSDAIKSGRVYQLTVALHGGAPERPDQSFEHQLKELDLLRIPELIATDVLTFLDVPFSADKLAKLTAPPPSRRSLGGINSGGMTTPRILLAYSRLSQDMAEMHYSDDVDGIGPGECGRCVGAWDFYLIAGRHVNGAFNQLQSMDPPLELDSLNISIASNRIKRGRFREAFTLLMTLAPTHRGDSAYHTVLMRLAVALGEPELIDFALQTWREQDNSYTGKLRRGQFLVDLAWDARGDGFAYQVTPEGFRLFRSRLEDAQSEFEQAIAMNDRDWMARSHLITVAKGLGLPREFLLRNFKDAVRAHPGSANAYYSTYDYLLPKWYGRPWELLSFGKMCAESGLWRDEVPKLFESAVTRLAIDPKTGELNPEVLNEPAFRAALKSYLDESYRYGEQPQNINVYYALWGALAGQYGDVAESFTPKMMELTIRGMTVPMSTRLYLRDKVQAHTATGAVQTAALIRTGLAASRFNEVEGLIKQAASGSELPDAQLNRYRQALAQGRRLFEKRELTFTPQQVHEAWKLEGGKWSVDDQMLVCDISDFEQIALACPFGFGAAEITGTFETNDKMHHQEFHAPTHSATVPVQFHIDPRRQASYVLRNKVQLGWESHVPGDPHFELLSTKRNVRFRFGRNKPITAMVNGLIPGGFALQSNGRSGGQVRIGAIRVKLLDETQPPVAPPETVQPFVAQSKLAPHEIRRFGRSGVTIETFAFSPDRETLCVGFVDGVVELYDFASGKKLRELQRDQSYSPAAVGFTPDAQNVLISTHRTMLRLCDSKTGKPAAEVYSGRSSFGTRLFDIEFLPNGEPQFLTAANDGVRLWNADGVKLVKTFPFGDFAVHSVTCSSDGTRLLFGRSDGSTQLVDLKTGEQLIRVEGHAGPVECVHFSPDGLSALTCARLDSDVRLWDLLTGKLLKTITPHHSNIAALAFSSDGAFILTGGGQRNPVNQLSRKRPDTSVQVWDAKSGKILQRLEGHEFGISQVGFLPGDKTVISAGGDGMIRLWNLAADN